MAEEILNAKLVSEWRDQFRPTQRAPFGVSARLRRAIWALVSATLFRFSPLRLRSARRVLLRIFGAKVAAGVSVHNRARVDSPWNLDIGSQASIGENAWIYALDRITIGARTCVGQDAHLLSGSHDVNAADFRLLTKPIVVGEGCWIAARAILLPGVQVGDFAVIAAGAVVTKAMPAATICGGNPCVPLKPRTLRRNPPSP